MAKNAQITTDNLIGATSYRIGQVEWIELSYPMDITVGSETFVAGTVFRLPNAVIDKRYYDTLSTEADYTLTGRESYNQNNTIYYVEGEKHLRGLSNLGGRPQPNTWDTNTYSRAIYEITLAYLAREEGVNPNNIDNGLVSEDNGITLKIRYRPYTETNAVMFKDDQRGFQFHSSC